MSLNTSQHSTLSPASNMSREGYEGAVAAAKEYILAGDIFQIVLSQRFERRTFADPFEVYRALRVVNPSPYLVYLQVRISAARCRYTCSCYLPTYCLHLSTSCWMPVPAADGTVSSR